MTTPANDRDQLLRDLLATTPARPLILAPAEPRRRGPDPLIMLLLGAVAVVIAAGAWSLLYGSVTILDAGAPIPAAFAPTTPPAATRAPGSDRVAASGAAASADRPVFVLPTRAPAADQRNTGAAASAPVFPTATAAATATSAADTKGMLGLGLGQSRLPNCEGDWCFYSPEEYGRFAREDVEKAQAAGCPDSAACFYTPEEAYVIAYNLAADAQGLPQTAPVATPMPTVYTADQLPDERARAMASPRVQKVEAAGDDETDEVKRLRSYLTVKADGTVDPTMLACNGSPVCAGLTNGQVLELIAAERAKQAAAQ